MERGARGIVGVLAVFGRREFGLPPTDTRF
jgi:hypothetical protein